MKKIILLVSMIFFGLSLIACNGTLTITTTATNATTTTTTAGTTASTSSTSSTTATTATTATTTTTATSTTTTTHVSSPTDQVIQEPTGLAIQNTTLSWNPVDSAQGYNVYVNGNLETNVTTTSYDFSSLVTTDTLIFKVQTLAPQGYQDSALSVSLAYVPNKTAEIASVSTALQSLGMTIPQGFAEELVNKGMTSEELATMITNIQTYITDAQTNGITDLSGMFSFLDGIVNSTSNVEAIVSAVVKYLIPNLIQQQLEMLQNQKSVLESNQAQYSAADYQAQMNAINDSIAQYTAILNFINDNPDAAVLVVTNTIDYFMNVVKGISQDMINTIQSLGGTGGIAQMNAQEVLTVKTELVNVLRENLPSVQDTVMLIQFEQALMAATGSTNNVSSQITNYDIKQATEFRDTIKLFLDFLDSFDLSYFQAVQTDASSNMSQPMINADVAILTIEQFAQFKTDNQADFDAIAQVYTNSEKAIMYQNAVSEFSAIISSMGSPGVTNPLANLSFAEALQLSNMLGSAFDTLLNDFVSTDGQIVRVLTIMNNFSSDGTYNAANLESYTYTQYVVEMNSLNTQLMQQMYLLVGPVITGIAQSDYNVLENYLITLLPSILSQVLPNDGSIDFTILVGLVQNTLSSSYESQLTLVKNIITYINTSDLFQQIMDNQTAINEYYTNLYGADYATSDAYLYSDPYKNLSNMILLAKNYAAFMNDTNRALVDDIVGQFIATLQLPDMMTLTGMTTTQITDLQTNIGSLLDFLGTQSNIIKDYDPANLTTDQMTVLQNFADGLMTMVSGLTGSGSN